MESKRLFIYGIICSIIGFSSISCVVQPKELHLVEKNERRILLQGIKRICLTTNYTNSVLRKDGEPIDVLQEAVNWLHGELDNKGYTVANYTEKRNDVKFHDWLETMKNDPFLYESFDRSKSNDCDASLVVLFDATEGMTGENPYVSFTYAIVSDKKRIGAMGLWWDKDYAEDSKFLDIFMMTPMYELPFLDEDKYTKSSAGVSVIFEKELQKPFKKLATDVLFKYSLDAHKNYECHVCPFGWPR